MSNVNISFFASCFTPELAVGWGVGGHSPLVFMAHLGTLSDVNNATILTILILPLISNCSSLLCG